MEVAFEHDRCPDFVLHGDLRQEVRFERIVSPAFPEGE